MHHVELMKPRNRTARGVRWNDRACIHPSSYIIVVVARGFVVIVQPCFAWAAIPKTVGGRVQTVISTLRVRVSSTAEYEI